MGEDNIKEIINYAAQYDESLMRIFESMGVTFVDCEVGTFDKDDHLLDDDVPQ